MIDRYSLPLPITFSHVYYPLAIVLSAHRLGLETSVHQSLCFSLYHHDQTYLYDIVV